MRQVQWSMHELIDLREQAIHIAKDNPAAARRVTQRIRDSGNALADFATGHPGRASGTCEKSVSRLPYIIAYALSDDDTMLTIPRVFHTSRHLQSGQWPEWGHWLA